VFISSITGFIPYTWPSLLSRTSHRAATSTIEPPPGTMIWLAGATVLLALSLATLLWLLLASVPRCKAPVAAAGRRRRRSSGPAAAPAGPLASSPAPRWEALPDGILALVLAMVGPGGAR
jgi:hypothetical protein